MNRHDGSGIVSLDFICKHSRWRTRKMTRDCCFCNCFLFSYNKENVCNGTRHNTTVNTQTEKSEKTAGIQQHDPDQRKHQTNETVFTTAIHTGLKCLKSYLVRGAMPTCLATSPHASLFLLLSLKSLQDLS